MGFAIDEQHARRASSRWQMLLLALALAPLYACVDSHPVNDPSSQDASSLQGSPTVAQTGPPLCERWAKLQCDGEARCCSDPGRDQETCVNALQASCQEQLQLDSVAGNSLSGYDADAAEEKFDEFEKLVATCDPSVLVWELSPDGLRGMFHGTVAEGQSCKPPNVLTADRGTLATAVVACDDAGELACLPAALLGNWACAAKQASGASCLTDENCESGTYCDNPKKNPLGTCADVLPLMAACTGGSQCESSACVGGSCVELTADSAYCPSN